MEKRSNIWALLLLIGIALIGCQTPKPSPTLQIHEPKGAVLNPRAYIPEVKLIPLAPRITDLNNEVVYINPERVQVRHFL